MNPMTRQHEQMTPTAQQPKKQKRLLSLQNAQDEPD